MVAVKVCIGSCCHLRGAEKVVEKFQYLIDNENFSRKIELKGSFCMGNCSETGVLLSVNGESHEISSESAESFFFKTITPLVH